MAIKCRVAATNISGYIVLTHLRLGINLYLKRNEKRMSLFRGLVAVIPTRNRAELAIQALLSLLHQNCTTDFQVLVSDNSSNKFESDKLSEFCKQLTDNRVTYVVPPEDMSMSLHWDWAIKKAVAQYRENHYLFLTDRMILRKRELAGLISLVKTHPNEVISFNHDRINDFEHPVILELSPWSSTLTRINSSKLLSMSSQMVFHPSLPRMLNCVVPRSVLMQLVARFGSIFSSVSPDFCFCYRLLGTRDHIYYYDKPIIVHYAMSRSNGACSSRGILSNDSTDFRAHLPTSENIISWAPLPGLVTVGNAIINEYLFVHHELGTRSFPSLNMRKYFAYLGREISKFMDDRIRSGMLAMLKLNGWRGNSSRKLYKFRCLIERTLFPGLRFKTVQSALQFANENYLPKPNSRLYLNVFLFSNLYSSRFRKWAARMYYFILCRRAQLNYQNRPDAYP